MAAIDLASVLSDLLLLSGIIAIGQLQNGIHQMAQQPAPKDALNFLWLGMLGAALVTIGAVTGGVYLLNRS